MNAGIELDDSTFKKLREIAQLQGVSVDEIANQIVNAHLSDAPLAFLRAKKGPEKKSEPPESAGRFKR